MEQPGADENWQRLEKELLAQQKKKRRAGAWLLGLLLLLGGSAALVWGLKGNGKEADTLVETATAQPQPVNRTVTAQSPATASTQPNNSTPNSAQPFATPVAVVDANANVQGSRLQRKGRHSITHSGGDMAMDDVATNKPLGFAKKGSQKTSIGAPAATNEVDTEANDDMLADKGTVTEVLATVEPTAEPKEAPAKDFQAAALIVNHSEPLTDTQNEMAPTAMLRKDKKTTLPGPQLELAAGVDVSNGYIGSGKYGIAMLRLALNRKANLVVGAGYASNAMSESYKQADKPNLLNQEIDAKVRGLNMLQFPILYEQAIKENKLLFRAGITPVYILNASIVNIPNGFGGNPSNYRTFTLKDINRLNVLFTAGLQLRLAPRLGLELKAHYGLTELVKNSYINQSGENNNFKSTQLGLLFMIGKKR